MAKRKNPLKDLDAFLKQEASSFVKPTPQEEEPSSAKVQLSSSEDIIAAIERLATNNPATYRQELYEIIKSSIEKLDHSAAEDKMLINTILYLKDKDNWKTNVKDYWEEHLSNP